MQQDEGSDENDEATNRNMVSSELSVISGIVELLQSGEPISEANNDTMVSMIQQAQTTFENAPEHIRQILSTLMPRLSTLVSRLQSGNRSEESPGQSLDNLAQSLESAREETDFGVDIDQLLMIVPNLSRARAAELVPHINTAMQRFHIETPEQQAMFIAQCSHETGGFQTFREHGSVADLNTRYFHRLGNTLPDDGSRYRGRGAIQITGRDLYDRYGDRLGLNLEANPTLAEQDEVAFLVSAAYWTTRRSPARSWFQANRADHDWSFIPDDYATNDQRETLNEIARRGTGEAYDYISVGINPRMPYERISGSRHRPFERAARAFRLTTGQSATDLTELIDGILNPAEEPPAAARD